MAFRGEIQVKMNTGELRRLDDIIDGKVMQFATLVVRQAKQYTKNFKGYANPDPRKRPTGNLSASLLATPIGRNNAQVQSRCGYGAYVELGTSKMQAQPYFAPAVADAVNEVAGEGEWA